MKLDTLILFNFQFSVVDTEDIFKVQTLCRHLINNKISTKVVDYTATLDVLTYRIIKILYISSLMTQQAAIISHYRHADF